MWEMKHFHTFDSNDSSSRKAILRSGSRKPWNKKRSGERRFENIDLFGKPILLYFDHLKLSSSWNRLVGEMDRNNLFLK